MSSTKRTNKNKASPQDNNTIVEARNKTNDSKAKQKTSTENVVQNIAEPLGKMASIRHGKKDKNEKNKDQSESDSDNDIKGNKQHNDDEANNMEDDHDNDDDDDDDNNKDDDDNDDDNNNGDKDDISQSGFSNGSTENKTYNNKNKNQHCHTGLSAENILYEEELVCCSRNDTVVMDVQLIKGVLPDLFAVLKFLESDNDLVYNGIICHYFIKKLQVAESKQQDWWKQNCHAVRKLIDGRCASASNLVK